MRILSKAFSIGHDLWDEHSMSCVHPPYGADEFAQLRNRTDLCLELSEPRGEGVGRRLKRWDPAGQGVGLSLQHNQELLEALRQGACVPLMDKRSSLGLPCGQEIV